MTGRYDPVTAALHIILGGTFFWPLGIYGDIIRISVLLYSGTQMEVNMASVHCNHKLVHYATMMAAYGMFGDVIKESEASRGLGTLRYPVSSELTLPQSSSSAELIIWFNFSVQAFCEIPKAQRWDPNPAR